ncbi:trypsin-like protease [Metarhizium album ARSEF 1941]|uniref:Trypsin-like protease n=1 Tax=Metarhizium album (strain ARSEF 1941) TaxID=1081103 RepID=A0A0B2WNQ8_METAS|nr:trypsin-like protease [Metarhizium album ARSEF 1941]KHN95259.1 trypsin-like protease [Metarhizium album ARSEF 1941]
MFSLKVARAAAAMLALQTAAGVPILNGEDAKPEEFPSVVGFAPGCAGTTDLWPSLVIVGATDRKQQGPGVLTFKISSFYTHPGYDRETPHSEHDIAILKLSRPVPETANISYPELSGGVSDPQPGSYTTAVGWGHQGPKKSTTVLQKVALPIVGRDECGRMFQLTVPDSSFCAGYRDGRKDTCSGDSGGPTYDAEGTVIGVTMYGTTPCGLGYAFYARVDAHLDFIQQHL